MNKILFLIPILALCGCTSNSPVDINPHVISSEEQKAHDAAEWVKTRSGFIENAVSSITQVAVYSSQKDANDRIRTLEIMHAIAGNINALVASGTVNPDEIKDALKINEPYFGEVASALTSIIQIELKNFDKNGYQEFAVAILSAVSKGIEDGSTL